MKNKIVLMKELEEICRKARAEDKKIVATSGCFDILHAGHVTYLEEAKEKGDILIVLLNGDISVQKLKGKERPIVAQEERAIVLSGLACVDYICIFEQTVPCDAIEHLHPDIWVKGEDYAGKNIIEADVIKAYGGLICYVPMKKGCSSTNIIEKIKGLV